MINFSKEILILWDEKKGKPKLIGYIKVDRDWIGGKECYSYDFSSTSIEGYKPLFWDQRVSEYVKKKHGQRLHIHGRIEGKESIPGQVVNYVLHLYNANFFK